MRVAEHIFLSRICRFRKIVKSQRAEVLTAAILGHACEEGRHALGLKKLAVKLGGAGFDSYAPQVLLCGEEAEAIFRISTSLATKPLRIAPPMSASGSLTAM